jgi:hypothetical protein
MKLVGGRYATSMWRLRGHRPISDPRLIVAVMIDEPSNGKHYGGDVAAPIFSQVTAGALRSLGVAPDAPLKPLQVARQGVPASRAGGHVMSDSAEAQVRAFSTSWRSGGEAAASVRRLPSGAGGRRLPGVSGPPGGWPAFH